MTLLVNPPPRSAPTRPDAGSRAGRAPAFDAVVFDLDGVVTDTAAVHAAAWKEMFDEYLRRCAEGRDEPWREFRAGTDYREHVDGRPRYAGVEAFLASRGIRLPAGSPEDAPDRETVCGLGNRKNEHFNRIIASSGVRLYGSTVALIEALRARGVRVGLATSSRNAGPILARTGTAALFATVVDGLVSAALGLKGKPHPDIFTTAAAALGARPERTIVVEDAVSGVRAGAAGGFGLVVGVARENNAQDLRDAGADLVVRDLAETGLDDLDARLRAKREGPE